MLTSSSPKYCSLWMNWSARPYETLLSCIARSIRRRHLIFPCGSLPHITRRFCDVAWNTSPDWRSVYVWNSGSLSFLLVVPSSQPKQDLKGSSFGDVQLKMIQDIICCNPNYNTVLEKYTTQTNRNIVVWLTWMFRMILLTLFDSAALSLDKLSCILGHRMTHRQQALQWPLRRNRFYPY